MPATTQLPGATPAATTSHTHEAHSPATPTSYFSHPNPDDAGDLLLFSSPEFGDTPSQKSEDSPVATLKTEDKSKVSGSGDVRGEPLCSVIIKPAGYRVSYKEALLRNDAYKPRHTSSTAGAAHQWQKVQSRRSTKSRGTVWSRLGSEQSRIQGGATRAGGVWDRLQPRPTDGHLLALLKARAGRRCFNCFAPDHHIAQCRDPPKCLLCSRFGHKARYCKAAPLVEARGKGKEPARSPVEEARKQTQVKTMDLPEFVPGAPENRPQMVVACAARTQDIRDAERQRELHALVGVQFDARVPLGAGDVARDVRQQLRIPDHALEVQVLGSATFILRFGSPELRNSVLAMHTIPAGSTGLRLMPWNRRVRATAGSLRFRARICLEGVPNHACNPEAVTQLFSPPSFIDEVDYEVFRDVERSCFNLWVWMSDPNSLPKQAILKIEEPYVRTGPSGLPILRHEAARTLDYEVLIHLERVLDYAPLPNCPLHSSFESDISGIPDDEPEEEWPARHFFTWSLGIPDGERLPIQGGRVPVRARLGGRRDRSPPDGGSSGSFGGRPFRRMPPAAWRDMPGGSGSAGQRRGQTGGHDGRRHASGVDWSMEVQAMAPQHGQGGCTVHAMVDMDGMGDLLPLQNAADSFPIRENLTLVQTQDPMRDEATLSQKQQQGYGTQQAACAEEPWKNGRAVTAEMECPNAQRIAILDHHVDPMVLEASQVLEANMVDTNIEMRVAELAGHAAAATIQGESLISDGQPVFGRATVPIIQRVTPDAQGQTQMEADVGLNIADGEKNGLMPQHEDQMVPSQIEHLQSGGPITQKKISFAKKLTDSLLPQPELTVAKGKAVRNTDNNLQHSKKETPASRKSARIASKKKPDLTMEEQATALLMRKCGLLDENKIPNSETHNKFRAHFIEPLEQQTVGNVRETFGISEGNGADVLGVIAINAEA